MYAHTELPQAEERSGHRAEAPGHDRNGGVPVAHEDECDEQAALDRVEDRVVCQCLPGVGLA